MGLKVTIKEEFDKEQTKGKVIRTEPEALAELTEGQEVILYVSKGEETALMPNVEGRDVLKASTMITDSRFKSPLIVNVYSDKEKDTVIEQSHEKNTHIPLSSEIVLYVSRGEFKTVEIDLTKETQQGVCYVRITRQDGSEAFAGEVTQENPVVILTGEAGYGKQVYTISIAGESWEYEDDFGD
jgi:hypothetical protein